MPANAYFIRNAALAAEVLLSHLESFHASFLVDFTGERYSGRSWYGEARRRFAFLKGSSYSGALRARKGFLAFLGLFIGKWPNTLALQPGGVTKAVTSSEIVRALGVLHELRGFVEQTLLGCELERVLELKTMAELQELLADETGSDLGLYLKLARDLGLERLGKGSGRFLCCDGYVQPDGSALYKGGFANGGAQAFEPAKVAEHTKHSFFAAGSGQGTSLWERTEPDAEKKGAYSWVKAPRYQGEAVEVGPLARLIINRHPLAIELWSSGGANVHSRVLARVLEVLVLLRKAEEWVRKIDPEEPFCTAHGRVAEAQGVGLIEAPRGVLGHWVSIEDYRIRSYQIVTPTAWNMSPRDSAGNPGPVEQALVGTPVEDEANPVEVGHVIRSFDPCLFCSVH
jgi:hydrogenase large subunit